METGAGVLGWGLLFLFCFWCYFVFVCSFFFVFCVLFLFLQLFWFCVCFFWGCVLLVPKKYVAFWFDKTVVGN